MNQFRTGLVVLVVLLIAVNIFTVGKYLDASAKLKTTQAAANQQSVNVKYLDFTRLFLEKVLRAKGEVSFADRLQLENTVRELSDPEVLVEWNAFVGSKSETDAQEAVKSLLSTLTQKIRAK